MPVTGTDVTSTKSNGAARRIAHPALVLLIIAGAQLMVVLDATIVNIALPSMGDYFHKSQTDMTWALNAYTLAFGGLLLLGGRAGDILGRRRMFIVGLALFSVGSLAGGLADSFALLLAGRVLQGIGGAIASPTALSLITTSFEEGAARNRAIGVYAAVSGAGAALGLLLGGILTEYLTWRWVLFVNVPIGAVLIVGAFMYLHESERLRGKFDFLGALVSVAGMTTLVYAFIHVAHTNEWGSTSTVLLFVGAVALLVAFVLLEAFVIEEPMMPIHIFENRSRAGAYLVMLIVGAGMFGMFFFLTFFVQQVMRYSPVKAGLAFVPVAIIIGIVSQIVAQLLPRVGPKVLIAAGSILMTASLLWLSTVNADSGYLDKIFPGMLVLAVGMGFIFVPITTVAVSKVVNTEAGLASALLNVGQQVGGSIGLSVLATVAATTGRHAQINKVNELTAQTQAGTIPPSVLQHFGELGGVTTGHPASAAALQDNAAIHAVAQVQAHSSGMGFLAAAIFGAVAVVVALVVINVKKSDLPSPQEAMMASAPA
jgi:EmrB/QacA subfamily drug resistance transporter